MGQRQVAVVCSFQLVTMTTMIMIRIVVPCLSETGIGVLGILGYLIQIWEGDYDFHGESLVAFSLSTPIKAERNFEGFVG